MSQRERRLRCRLKWRVALSGLTGPERCPLPSRKYNPVQAGPARTRPILRAFFLTGHTALQRARPTCRARRWAMHAHLTFRNLGLAATAIIALALLGACNWPGGTPEPECELIAPGIPIEDSQISDSLRP